MDKYIHIKGAQVNNLKNVDLKIPINKLTCFCGPSGSGKTSIAFHTLYAESKRRFLNSFPTYLKFFSERPSPVDVDEIMPVLPVFGLPQNNPVVGARSNVADVMQLTEHFQSLFFNYGEQRCFEHKSEFQEVKLSNYIEKNFHDKSSVYYVLVAAEDFIEFFQDSPFPSRSLKSRRSKTIQEFNKDDKLWEVARFKLSNISNLEEKLKPFLDENLKLCIFDSNQKKISDLDFKSNIYKCPEKGCSSTFLKDVSMLNLSPYNALGACGECSGFGEVLEYDEEKLWDEEKSVVDGGVTFLNYKRFLGQKNELIKEMKKKKISTTKRIKDLDTDFFDILYQGGGSYNGFNAFFNYLERKRYKMHVRIFMRNIQKSVRCGSCSGTRLGDISKSYHIDKTCLYDLLNLNILDINRSIQCLNLPTNQGKKLVKKLKLITQTAVDIGLGHLYISRKAKSVSAGEYQRLLLLKYLSYEGVGSLFIFDEPSLGLSLNEQKYLLKGFQNLLKQNNTVVIIDHSKYFQKKSEFLVAMGPGSGSAGGEVLYCGDTTKYKFVDPKINLKKLDYNKKRNWITVEKPEVYGLKFNSFKLPVDEITWVSGSSGSGKTACLINTLANNLNYRVYDQHLSLEKGKFKKIDLDIDFEQVIVVDSNLTRFTSRSSVGSMTDLFSVVRKHFAGTSSAKAMGLKDSHFSYNSQLGQCPNCEGRGVTIVEMQFLEDIVLTCEDCGGKKLKPIYANISDGHMTVDEAYNMPIKDVFANIKLTPKFQRILKYLEILNLDYLSLSRGINSLSGGEKQRIFLLNKLQKNLTNSILFFENVSFGLSDVELTKLGTFLQELAQKNNTIVIIDQDDFFEKISTYSLTF